MATRSASPARARLRSHPRRPSRGAGWSLLAVGAVQAIGALIYAFQVGAQIEHYSSSLARDAAAFQVEETTHLRGTMDRFIIYLVTELTLTIGGAGLATYGFVAGEDLWAGIGIGVAALALPLLIIDVINQQRASRYADRVHRMELPARPSNGLDRALGPSLDAFVVSTSHAF